MITLSKTGDAIKFTFVDNGHYLYNGTIDVPLNSLSLVTDESDMATFKKSATNDIFISALYSDFGMTKAELETWYKNNMVGGSGGSGGGISSGEVQSMIDESISGKQDTLSAGTGIDITNNVISVTGGSGGGISSGEVQSMIDESTSDYFDGAEYDSGTTRINFKHGNTIKGYIDASAFIVDGMVDDVRIETISGVSYLTIDFNTESGKQDIYIPLTDIFNPSNYYDKTEIDGLISAFTTSEDVTESINAAVSGKVDTSTYNSYTAATDSTLSGKQDVLSNANVLSGISSSDITNWNGKSDFSGSYNDLTDKPTIPTVPSSNTAFTNDAGYITSGEAQTQIDNSISGKADTSAVTESINAAVSGKVDVSTYNVYTAATDSALSGKQDALSAGTGIDITNNVISATGGGSSYSAGTGIDITNNVISVNGVVETSAITTSITSGSTDSQVPSAKAVYDSLGDIQTLLSNI